VTIGERLERRECAVYDLILWNEIENYESPGTFGRDALWRRDTALRLKELASTLRSEHEQS
jgi:hypothetical protein